MALRFAFNMPIGGQIKDKSLPLMCSKPFESQIYSTKQSCPRQQKKIRRGRRERFHNVVQHRQADRAVFDLAGNPQTRVDYQETKQALAALLHIEGPPVSLRGDMHLDERILQALDIDTRSVGGMATPDTIHVREEGGIIYDAFGIGYRMIDGRAEICYSPLKDCTLDELNAYEFPDPARISRQKLEQWAKDAEWLHTQTEYAVIAEHPVLGVFELGCWMFGFDDYLYRLLAEPEIVHAFSKRWLAYQKEVIRQYYGAIGAYIDATTSGDDFGTQKAQFMSTATFDEMIAPYMKERISYTKKFTNAYYQHHTCGSVFGLIPSLLDCGIDILNPIQPGVEKMEPERLKLAYGDVLAFWGGVDTQKLLPGASPQEVKQAVKKLLSVLDVNGGYILAPAHTIQHDVPAENIIAIYQGAKEYYGQ